MDYTDKASIPSSGPIQASFPLRPHPLQTAWVDTYECLDSIVKTDPIQGTAVGGLTMTNAVDASKGERSHSGVAYLRPALDRPKLTVVTDALVQKIIFDENVKNGLVATGAKYLKNDESCIVQAHREVIICAGAFQSPQILELSGIGPKAIIEAQGIECLFDNSNVGGTVYLVHACEKWLN